MEDASHDKIRDGEVEWKLSCKDGKADDDKDMAISA